jgi:hypothetical protein
MYKVCGADAAANLTPSRSSKANLSMKESLVRLHDHVMTAYPS